VLVCEISPVAVMLFNRIVVVDNMRLTETLRKSFIAGIALVAPLVVTIVAFTFLFGWLRGVLDPIIQETALVELTRNFEIVAEISALIILFFVIALLGYLAQRSVGAWTFGLIDRVIGLIPMVSVIYSSVRQVSDALMQQTTRYESVVLVEYPREGLYALGFITSESPNAVERAIGGDAYNVYLPSSPNPTQGRFLLVPADDVQELDLSVSRTIRLLVTTGIAEDQEEMQQLQREVESRIDEGHLSMEDAYR
jgi:uncharacterized membrane protein